MGCSPYQPVYGSTAAAIQTTAVMSAAVGRDDALRPRWAQPFRRLYCRGHRSAMSQPVVLAKMTGAGITVIR
ncbi:MAG: hypothetical protein WAO02_18360 [Verrucomicrobiia bacterium]